MTANHSTDDPIERFFATGNPNPGRIGCPGSTVLERLADRSLPADHPARTHLGECSPCYVEFSALRARHQRRRVMMAAGAIAASLVIAVFVMVRSSPERDGVAAVLNLEGETVVRGSENAREQLQRLPISDLDLSIYLPVGSEPGPYEVSVGGPGSPGATVEGRAEVNAEGLTLVRARLDLRGHPEGAYQLSVRRKVEHAQRRIYRVFLGGHHKP